MTERPTQIDNHFDSRLYQSVILLTHVLIQGKTCIVDESPYSCTQQPASHQRECELNHIEALGQMAKRKGSLFTGINAVSLSNSTIWKWLRKFFNSVQVDLGMLPPQYINPIARERERERKRYLNPQYTNKALKTSQAFKYVLIYADDAFIEKYSFYHCMNNRYSFLNSI